MVVRLRARALLLGGSACVAICLTLTTAARALNPTSVGAPAPGSARESPYASAKDEDQRASSAAVDQPTTPTEALGGHRAAGSRKDSPYAAAKDEQAVSVETTLGHLWGLLIPVLLAGGSYTWLRRRDVSDLR